jgi:uncharacterized protein with HEPN domain
MSKREVQNSLEDMLEAARRILLYTENIAFAEFQKDFKTQDAVLRNLEVLGEAAKNIPEDFCEQYPDLPWQEMARTRDRLIHHYFGVNLDVVWGIADLELAGLIKKLELILAA